MVLPKICKFMRRTGMPETKFGRLSVNDPRLVHDLRNGREPGPSIIARVNAFIAAHGGVR